VETRGDVKKSSRPARLWQRPGGRASRGKCLAVA
jgi:hypothetical protein